MERLEDPAPEGARADGLSGSGPNGRVFLVSAARTPIGRFGGGLATTPATRLGAVAIRGALDQSALPADAPIDEVLMGQVLQAGAGQAPARQAALGANLRVATPATTINRVCGSGLKAIMLAAAEIRAGDAELVVAGGMENMSLAPVPAAQGSLRLPAAAMRARRGCRPSSTASGARSESATWGHMPSGSHSTQR